MLFSSSTSAYGGLSSVANAMSNDIWPWIIVVIGVPLAFFIIELLIDLIPNKKDPVIERADRAMADFDRLDWEGKNK